jgi:hypothetical protein
MRGADRGPPVEQDRPVPGSALLIAQLGMSLNRELGGRLASGDEDDGEHFLWRGMTFEATSDAGACSIADPPSCSRRWEGSAGGSSSVFVVS